MPSIRRLEVFKKEAQQPSEGVELQYVAVMQQGRVVDWGAGLALLAAALGARHKLPGADSIITRLRSKARPWYGRKTRILKGWLT